MAAPCSWGLGITALPNQLHVLSHGVYKLQERQCYKVNVGAVPYTCTQGKNASLLTLEKVT